MSSRLHVRILAGLLDRTAGSHVYHRELATRLAARGHRVSVVAFEDDELLRRTCEIHSVAPLPHPRRWFWRFLTRLKQRHCRRAVQKLELDRPDVVIAGEHLLAQAHADRFPDVPWIYLPHSLLPAHEIDGYAWPSQVKRDAMRIYTRIQSWALANAARTLRFTTYGCDILRSEYGSLESTRFFVNPIGIDIPAAVRTPREGSSVRLLFIGALNERKRILPLLTSLARVPERNWTLRVVGDGPQRMEAERLAHRLGIQGLVSFDGHQADPTDWYVASDLMLIASRSESLGLVVLEAMSHGVPVLGVRADDESFFNPFEELIDADVDGFLADDDEDVARPPLRAVVRADASGRGGPSRAILRRRKVHVVGASGSV